MKSVLITGANRSIGLETARQLAKKGFLVYLGARDLQKGEAAVRALTGEGYENIRAVQIDVTKPGTIEAAKQQIEREEGKLDILINNAGIVGNLGRQAATDTPVEAVQQVFDTNFFGVIAVTQAFLPLLRKSDNPRISNITSGLASLTLHSNPGWKYYAVKTAAYGPSKAALNAYTIVLSHELKDEGFIVNAIDPGYTATDFNNHTGPGTVESAAAFIVKHTIGDDVPTGRFYSHDIEDSSEESPW